MRTQNNHSSRAIALEAICSVVLAKKSLSNFDFPTTNDAPIIKALTFGTIRFYHQLNDIVTHLLKHSLKKTDLDIHCLLLLGAYQILHSNTAPHACIFESVELTHTLNKSWARGLVNAILRKIQSDKEKYQQQRHYAHPTWLIKKIKQYYPHHFEQILTQNNNQAPMTLRIHPKYNSDPRFNGEKIDIAPQARVLKQAINVADLPEFEQGSCFVQDASAQLAGALLNPKNTDLILDACCAPGGKTTHLSELAPKSTIIALDKNTERLKKVKQNIDRFAIKNIKLLHGSAQVQDWWDGVLFDKILLDAPCSATGVIRRHPDIKLLHKPKDITALVALQKQMLNNLWQMLKANGVLLYATCSILKTENEVQIADFLNHHQDALEEKINLDWGIKTSIGKQQLPQQNFDGFYYAKIIKC